MAKMIEKDGKQYCVEDNGYEYEYNPPTIDPIELIKPQPTNQDVIDGQLVMLDVMATMYEDMMAKGTV